MHSLKRLEAKIGEAPNQKELKDLLFDNDKTNSLHPKNVQNNVVDQLKCYL